MCHKSHVMCHVSFAIKKKSYKVVELVGGGSVINGTYPVQFLSTSSLTPSPSSSHSQSPAPPQFQLTVPCPYQTLCQAMRQLSCLLKQAEDMFQDLGVQVQGVHTRAAKVNSRLEDIQQTVTKYNPKEEKLRKWIIIILVFINSHVVFYCLT